ncbi:hypothetical protein Bbelb_111580 [Branchiostoma belcheri]|nr:hypothetical protein Bbelb_111580 [Branchiostoma belcheri]
MGKRNRGSSSSSAGENSPSQQNPPPKTLKMVANPLDDVSKPHHRHGGAEFQDNEMKRLNDSLLAERRERIKAGLLAERYSVKADVVMRGIPYRREENSAHGKLIPERNAETEKAKDSKVSVSIWVPPKCTYAVLMVNGKEKKRVDAVDILLSKQD